jgi:hypothetical protein
MKIPLCLKHQQVPQAPSYAPFRTNFRLWNGISDPTADHGAAKFWWLTPLTGAAKHRRTKSRMWGAFWNIAMEFLPIPTLGTLGARKLVYGAMVFLHGRCGFHPSPYGAHLKGTLVEPIQFCWCGSTWVSFPGSPWTLDGAVKIRIVIVLSINPVTGSPIVLVRTFQTARVF